MIHIREGEERIKHLDGVAVALQLEKDRVASRIKKLKKELKNLEKATKYRENCRKALDESHQTERTLRQQIEKLGKDEVVKVAMAKQKQLRQDKGPQQRDSFTSTRSVQQTPVPNNTIPSYHDSERPPLDSDFSSNDEIDDNSEDPDTEDEKSSDKDGDGKGDGKEDGKEDGKKDDDEGEVIPESSTY
jgi:hypothetical protein